MIWRAPLSGLAALALALSSAGCSREKPQAPALDSANAETNSGTNSEVVAVPTAPVTPVVVQDSANVNALLAQLTEAVRKYGFEKRRMPKTIEEVVAAGYVAGMPQPPAGKQFAIDPKGVQVVLVNR